MRGGGSYCGFDDTLGMKVLSLREGDCTAFCGSSFQSLTVRGKHVLFL